MVQGTGSDGEVRSKSRGCHPHFMPHNHPAVWSLLTPHKGLAILGGPASRGPVEADCGEGTLGLLWGKPCGLQSKNSALTPPLTWVTLAELLRFSFLIYSVTFR